MRRVNNVGINIVKCVDDDVSRPSDPHPPCPLGVTDRVRTPVAAPRPHPPMTVP